MSRCLSYPTHFTHPPSVATGLLSRYLFSQQVTSVFSLIYAHLELVILRLYFSHPKNRNTYFRQRSYLVHFYSQTSWHPSLKLDVNVLSKLPFSANSSFVAPVRLLIERTIHRCGWFCEICGHVKIIHIPFRPLKLPVLNTRVVNYVVTFHQNITSGFDSPPSTQLAI